MLKDATCKENLQVQTEEGKISFRRNEISVEIMPADKNCFTKFERKELRKLAGLAYERELAAALKLLQGKFEEWNKGAISSFELNSHIHEFHNGVSRQLWGFYTGGHSQINLRSALSRGIIAREEISKGILEKLGGV